MVRKNKLYVTFPRNRIDNISRYYKVPSYYDLYFETDPTLVIYFPDIKSPKVKKRLSENLIRELEINHFYRLFSLSFFKKELIET